MFFLQLLAVVVQFSPADAFGTINEPYILEQNSEHERITRAAISCLGGGALLLGDNCFQPDSIGRLAGSRFDFGGVGLPDKNFADPEWHFDDADFFPGSNVRSREDRNGQLFKSFNHMKRQAEIAINAAINTLNVNGVIQEDEVEGTCWWSTNLNFPVRNAKCSFVEAFGAILHVVQDFYSHSNWADVADGGRELSITNPMGYGREFPAEFLDWTWTNAEISTLIPPDLTTGCYRRVRDDANKCTGRITHAAINKDGGIIDPVLGRVLGVESRNPRALVGNNFQRAVNVAVLETFRQWVVMQSEIQKQRPDTAAIMICALTHDKPVASCGSRKVAIVIDSSGSNTRTDPQNLRIRAGNTINSRLHRSATAGSAADRVAVIEFDTAARVVYPLGDPAGASFQGIDSSGGTNIGSGISAAINQLTSQGSGVTAGNAAIVVLTDGEDNVPANQVAQLERARSLGIEVSVGFLSPTAATTTAKKRDALPEGELQKRQQAGDNVVRAILATGGIYAIIDSASALDRFAQLFLEQGLPTGGVKLPLTILKTGVSVASIAPQPDQPKRFYFPLASRSSANVTVRSQVAVPLFTTLKDSVSGVTVGARIVPAQGEIVFQLMATANMKLDLVVAVQGGVNASGTFVVGLDTLVPRNPFFITGAFNSTGD